MEEMVERLRREWDDGMESGTLKLSLTGRNTTVRSRRFTLCSVEAGLFHLQQINAVEMPSLRSKYGVSQKDRYRKSDIRERGGLKEDVVTKEDRDMLRWFGHLEGINGSRLTKQIYRAVCVMERSARVALENPMQTTSVSRLSSDRDPSEAKVSAPQKLISKFSMSDERDLRTRRMVFETGGGRFYCFAYNWVLKNFTNPRPERAAARIPVLEVVKRLMTAF
ncbi:hypothetical protein EVAR_49011_1 [Eumeta japonica]|uniref:Uncharacterized protein n=1 Tax=Eumeta variegata TaxID=151549 RepID=A0A4C1XN21_EUMVA|nr:hypothetical protein EVAR_49011_1 [Eumeta japonica]